MTHQMLCTRIIKRRGRPKQAPCPTPSSPRPHSCLLHTLWHAGLIPFAFHEAGLTYARLRRETLRLMEAPSLRTTSLKERLGGTGTWEHSQKQTHLFKVFMAIEQHLSTWERERLQLLRRTLEEHKPLERATLERLGQSLYPVLKDLAHFLQNLSASGLLPFKE